MVTEATRTARTAALACIAVALVSVAVATGLGHAVVGLALATGMVLGSVNGFIAGRLVTVGVPFAVTSLMRLVTLTMVGLVIGLAFGLSRVWLVVIGIGAAQVILSLAALREVVRR